MNPTLLLSISEFFGDMGFIIKLFVLIAILGFLNQHIENKILKVVVAIFMIYVVLFASTTLRIIYVVYAVMGMGISSMFVDYFFMGQGKHAKAEQEIEMLKQRQMQGAMQNKALSMGLDPRNEEHMQHVASLPEFGEGAQKKKKGFLGGLFG